MFSFLEFDKFRAWIVVVPDPSFRRQREHRFGKIEAQFLMQICKVIVTSVEEPVWDLAHTPVAAVLNFQLVDLCKKSLESGSSQVL